MMTALKVFVDFDGTVTGNDVGNAFFRKFGGEACEKLVEDYRAGIMSAQECFRREIASIGALDRSELDLFLASQRIDRTFKDFIAFCREQQIEFHVVSDGLDYYIYRILEANGIAGISVFSNILRVFPADGEGRSKFSMAFPYPDVECRACACCKRNVMLSRAGDQELIVYVGEGFPDGCPVQYADVVFAKDALQTFCQRENISYYLYESFADVVERLKELTARKRLRKRHRAELLRREIFSSEP